ncbi:dipeptidase [Nocardioides sp. NPDC057772]|uniref:dipeptidase n=1 Tax=Nocardioides sp. NPDC057772 TaxID=3346245 RepID=UPI00367129E0
MTAGADAGTAVLVTLADRIDAGMPALMADLESLVRIPSVSSLPRHRPDVERSAAAVARLLEVEGLDVVVVRAEDGLPSVIGHRPGPPGAPTVLLYAHHDVQPTGDPEAWTGAPFEPTERDGRLYGRGAADDKAGLAVHLAAIRALGADLPVGVTVLIEGEEEIGSPTLPTLLAEHRDLLAADVVVIADALNWEAGTPALTVSLRGLVETSVEVATLEHPLHSGAFGGAVPDALAVLVRMLASLHDEDGSVAVPGLVARSVHSPVEYDEQQFRTDAGLLPGVALTGTGSLTDRLWNQPSITVTGLDCPSVADAPSALTATASAKISMRLAPGDDPDRALRALTEHIHATVPFGARVRVMPGIRAHPFAADPTGPAHRLALDVLGAAWPESSPVTVGVGGTVPLVHLLASAYPHAALLVTGVEDPDTRAHGYDESLHLGDFRNACLAEALLLHRLGSPDRAD